MIFSTFYPYLEDIKTITESKETSGEIKEIPQLMNILKAALCHQLLELSSLLQKQDGNSFNHKWNKMYQIQISQVARLHAIYLTGKAFADGLNKIQMKKENMIALEKLWKIYLCDNIIRFADYALIYNYVTSKQLMDIYSYNQSLIESVRPSLFALSEGPIFDESLVQGTSVVNLDSDYASGVYQLATFSKLNNKTKLDSFDKCVQPLSKKLRNLI